MSTPKPGSLNAAYKGIGKRLAALEAENDDLRAALAAKDAPALEAVPVHQFRKWGCSDWYDGLPDHQDGGGPYEARTLYTAPAKQEAAPLAAVPEGLTDAQIEAFFQERGGKWDGNRWTIEDADLHPFVRSLMGGIEFIEAVANHYTSYDNQESLLCNGCGADLGDGETHKPDCIVLRARSIIATKQSPAAPTDAKESTS